MEIEKQKFVKLSKLEFGQKPCVVCNVCYKIKLRSRQELLGFSIGSFAG